MKVRQYQVTLTGESPLLMHACSIDGQNAVKKWQKDPLNKGISTAGDDRCPAFTWITYCYHNGKNLVIDADNIMSMLRDAGAKCPATTGRGSLKAATQCGIISEGLGWDLYSNDRLIPWEPLERYLTENDFEKHLELVEQLGFELFQKRATVGKNKHIRIRPRFNNWRAEGVITVLDEQLTQKVVQTLLNMGGFYVGICDWRPGCKNPGQFGRFSATVKELKN